MPHSPHSIYNFSCIYESFVLSQNLHPYFAGYLAPESDLGEIMGQVCDNLIWTGLEVCLGQKLHNIPQNYCTFLEIGAVFQKLSLNTLKFSKWEYIRKVKFKIGLLVQKIKIFASDVQSTKTHAPDIYIMNNVNNPVEFYKLSSIFAISVTKHPRKLDIILEIFCTFTMAIHVYTLTQFCTAH